MFSKKRLLGTVLLIVLLMSGAGIPVHAQDTCPQPAKCQLAQQGLALMQKYNIDPSLANGLLPFLAKGDLAGAGTYFAANGVPTETINALAQDAQSLIQQGLNSGAWQQLATDMAVNQLTRSELSPEQQSKILQMVGDPGLSDFLISRGISPDQAGGIVAKLEEAQAMGYDAGSLDEYVRIQGVAKSLEGLPEEERQAFLDVYIEQGREGFQSALNDAGYDGQALVTQAGANITDQYSTMGFKPEEASAFQAKAFFDNVQELQDDPEALAEYVQRRGFFGDGKEAENEAFVEAVTNGDTEAVREILSQDPWFAANVPDLVEKFLSGEEIDAPGVDPEDMESDPEFWEEYMSEEDTGDVEDTDDEGEVEDQEDTDGEEEGDVQEDTGEGEDSGGGEDSGEGEDSGSESE